MITLAETARRQHRTFVSRPELDTLVRLPPVLNAGCSCLEGAMWKIALVMPLAVIACGACDNRAGSPPAAASAPSQAAAARQPTWRLQTSATAGAALVYTDADDAELLRLACRRSPADLYAALPTFTRIASEDRLTIGVGEALATLVVSMEGPDTGLIATGQPQRAIMAPLLEGKPVGVSYGARQLMLQAPPRPVSQAFVEACGTAG